MPDARELLEWLWWNEKVGARLVRAALAPLEVAFRGGVALRNALYDAHLLRSKATAIPAIGVGNLSVGGTGKTPVAAWIARLLAGRGARPAIVLRGYGDDELRVHRALNPDVPVVVSADRASGTADAAHLGCDIAVLDDAFQHRKTRRSSDLVLVSADRWSERRRSLPAGPWREPLGALRRAAVAAVTRKAASAEEADDVARSISHAAPGVAIVRLSILPDALRPVSADVSEAKVAQVGLESVAGRTVLAVAAVGDPEAFARQLERIGARVTLHAFPDHHRFRQSEVDALAASARAFDSVVCTLKDAVKLSALWPRAASPLWYVSQRIDVERGGEAVEGLLAAALAERANESHETAGAFRPTDLSHGY